MIRITFDGTDKRLAVALRARGPQIRAGVRAALERAMIELQMRVQKKLSGEVLRSHRGGGGLLGTVRVTPIEETDRTLTGGVQAGGGLFWWAKVHEWGGNMAYEIWPVNKKALAFFPAGSAGGVVSSGAFASLGFGRAAMGQFYFKSGKRRGEMKAKAHEAFGKAGGVVVQHVVHPPLPRRAFMGPALREMADKIRQDVFAAAAAAVR